jgi:hypothetical protein
MNPTKTKNNAIALLGVLMLADASNPGSGSTLGVMLPWHEDFRRHGAGNPLIHTC